MTIAFLGDSITLGYALDNKKLRYSSLVAEKLGFTEENYGITGTLIAKAGLNKEDGKDFVNRVHLIDDADVAVIFGGTNDYFWSDKEINGDDNSYFKHALDTILYHIKSTRQGKITLVVTPYPHNGVGNFLGGKVWNESSRHDTDAKNYNGHTLADYANVIITACELYNIPCLNLFCDFGFDWHIHTSDGCHPNEEGHKVLSIAIEKKLKELLNRT